jgi:prevent-host-death family protein
MPQEEISIQDLKKGLSGYISRAAEGETFVISKHGRPVARLVPVPSDAVWEGPAFGNADIRPVFHGRLFPRVLEILEEGREDRT